MGEISGRGRIRRLKIQIMAAHAKNSALFEIAGVKAIVVFIRRRIKLMFGRKGETGANVSNDRHVMIFSFFTHCRTAISGVSLLTCETWQDGYFFADALSPKTAFPKGGQQRHRFRSRHEPVR